MNWPQRIVAGLVAFWLVNRTQELQGAWRWIAGGLVVVAFLALDTAVAVRRQRADSGEGGGA